ncbi:MAG: hypothetical protein WAP37_03810, partial [Solirubrobacterales bacterium]
AASGDVRAASLASFMLGLPLAAAALVPDGSVGDSLYMAIQVINSAFPFKPSLELIQSGLSPGEDALVPALHLLALIALYSTIAGAAIKRRAAV